MLLPSFAGNRVPDPGLRRWLSRATISLASTRQEPLRRVLDCLQLPYPEDGIAALRLWGQTGDRPGVWIAAADPVYLEPRLDHLCLHALRGEQMPNSDLRQIFDYLQERLAGSDRYGFARIGACGYVRAQKPLPTARDAAWVIDQQPPNEHLPGGAQTSIHHTLLGEVEMALHEHAVNLRRETEGLPPVNSLWLWGGGFAPEPCTEPRPPLFADDPLLQGYWQSKTAVVEDWPGSIAACLEASVAGFVAAPAGAAVEPDGLQACLRELRGALRTGRISKLTLLLEDGHRLELLKSDAWKFWRRHPALFGAQ